MRPAAAAGVESTLNPNDAHAGTGKTVTLVECALQLLGAYPCARILLCAPLVSHVQLG